MDNGKFKVSLEGSEYEIFFNLKRLAKLEELTGKPLPKLMEGLEDSPSLTDMMLLFSVGAGLNEIMDLDRLPPNFDKLMQDVMNCLVYGMGADVKPKGKASRKKS